MTDDKVLRRTELRVLDDDEVDQMLKDSGLQVPSDTSKEDKIELLVRSSWPVEPLPKSRANSQRGRAISAFVDEGGRPRKGGTDLLEESLTISKDLGITREEALAQLRLYLRDLQRYYGFDMFRGEFREGHVVHAVLTDNRRLKSLSEAK